MDILEYSIGVFVALEAIILALFGFLYGAHVEYIKSAVESKKRYSYGVFYTAKIVKALSMIVYSINFIVAVDLLILLYYKVPSLEKMDSFLYIFNGGGLLILSFILSFVCHQLMQGVVYEDFAQ